ncbi:subunit Srp43 of signal recognition particle complex [Chloropicon primus]|uniref:Subunit Srp43 of signal recognition particle complex n=2 Tax=Chloropicon primus TaxID=1764295 RepID=A0A5B8MS22_9CHLO|nr:subunit Srp43 of signal recognition particle complex [Chloropicon primus]UPR01428.1 subunit Srp43 of signal recognition particle complex [Chloropicon primus]|eukprot:QDZ22210.1 subunit Srp43 of signal recognition particle complex [Chloropicon primus]
MRPGGVGRELVPSSCSRGVGVLLRVTRPGFATKGRSATTTTTTSPRCCSVGLGSRGRGVGARRGTRPLSSTAVLASGTQESNAVEAEVEELVGVRLVRDKESGKPYVQYLVKWQDDYEDSWESADDISEDLLRNYEDKWWKAVKTAAYDVIVSMLIGGRDALVSGVDDELRSALHYACGTGNTKCVKLLLVNGAEVDLRDKDGYTPLHIASGYMHKEIVNELIEAGADPEIKDNEERSALELVESLRDNLPKNNPSVFARKLQLEEVIRELEANLYEEVTPGQVLKARKKRSVEEEEKDLNDTLEAEMGFGSSDATAAEDEDEAFDLSEREFLVQWSESDVEPSWVPLKHMAEDVVEDFDRGMEYAVASRVLERRQVTKEGGEGDEEAPKEEAEMELEYLVEWSDGYENSWEPCSHVSSDLIKLFEQEQKQGQEGEAAPVAELEGISKN